jgi:hypothetical protein
LDTITPRRGTATNQARQFASDMVTGDRSVRDRGQTSALRRQRS